MNRQVVAVALVSIVSVFAGGCASQSSAGDEAAVREVLSKFLRDFENGDLAAMEAAFAEDAFTFPRAIMSADTTGPIRSSDYMRSRGLDPGMRQLIESWENTGAEGPPYMSLNPQDLQIDMFTDAAMATFHLVDGSALSRRTFILAKRNGAWQILHLHASNVVGTQ